MRARIGRLLRRWADRIDDTGAPKHTGLSFTYENGRGMVLHGEFGSIKASRDIKGCSLWRIGEEDYDRAWWDADDPAPRVLWENLAEGRRPFLEYPPSGAT